MVNSQVTQEIVRSLKLDTNVDKIPNAIPTIEVGLKNSKELLCANTSNTNSTPINMITTPLDRDFYICGASLSTIKDVTATSALCTLDVTINGQTAVLLSIAGLTLTVQSSTISQTFKNPIKIDRGTIVRITNSTATGNFRSSACIQYYLDEVT
jgi:hypothetical protein